MQNAHHISKICRTLTIRFSCSHTLIDTPPPPTADCPVFNPFINRRINADIPCVICNSKPKFQAYRRKIGRAIYFYTSGKDLVQRLKILGILPKKLRHVGLKPRS